MRPEEADIGCLDTLVCIDKYSSLASMELLLALFTNTPIEFPRKVVETMWLMIKVELGSLRQKYLFPQWRC